jgi:hypothetical protein
MATSEFEAERKGYETDEKKYIDCEKPFGDDVQGKDDNVGAEDNLSSSSYVWSWGSEPETNERYVSPSLCSGTRNLGPA